VVRRQVRSQLTHKGGLAWGQRTRSLFVPSTAGVDPQVAGCMGVNRPLPWANATSPDGADV